MRIVYSRVSTAPQSLLRQRRILTKAGLFARTEGVAEGFRPADGVLLSEDPATTSKVPALERPAFAKVTATAHPGDVLTVSELFRLCRDLVGIHAVRGWCQARGVALRVMSGPLSNFRELSGNDATTALLINVIIAVGRFQRDLQNELTAEGIAAAAEGRYRGRPPALTGAGPKWWRTGPEDTSAVSAIPLMVARSNPCSPKCRIAASLIRAAEVVMEVRGDDGEHGGRVLVSGPITVRSSRLSRPGAPARAPGGLLRRASS